MIQNVYILVRSIKTDIPCVSIHHWIICNVFQVFLNNETFLEALEGKRTPESLRDGIDVIGNVSKTAIDRLEEKMKDLNSEK